MELFARHIEQQFQRNLQQHVTANELKIKVERMKECFVGDSLPSPTTEVILAWNDLPNKTMDALPMSIKPGLVFLRVPPPTPTRLPSDTDNARLDDSSLNGSPDDDRLLVDNTDSAILDGMEFRDLEGFAMSEVDPMSRCDYPDQSLDGTINEEESFQSTERNSPSSDHDGLLSGGRASPTPVGFYNMVSQWLLDYRTRGMEPFIESLIAFGVVSRGTALLASRIARDVVRKVAKTSYADGKRLENTIRFTALGVFKNYWKSNDTRMEVSSTRAHVVPPTPYGINIAGLMGSLLDAKISRVKDIHVCLSLLSEGEKGFDRLCAMHALLIQANDTLCKNCSLTALMRLRDEVTSKDRETGEYLWITTPHSRMIITDILVTMERWLVSQAIRHDPFRISRGDRTIRQKAVGPRLRNGLA